MKRRYEIYFLVMILGLVVSCAEKASREPSLNPTSNPTPTPHMASSILREEVEVDSSEVDLSSLETVDPEMMISEFSQRKSFPFIYSTILLRSKSLNPYLIQVEFEGYLENEVQRSQQQWQEDVLERTTVGDVERWSKAPVILEIKEPKDTGELGMPQTKKLSNGKMAYLLKKELVLVFKTEAVFREFPWTTRAVSYDVRVDHLKLQGQLKILSAPDSSVPNWADITPSHPFPLLKVVSK